MKWGAPENLVWLWALPLVAWLFLWLQRRRLATLHRLQGVLGEAGE